MADVKKAAAGTASRCVGALIALLANSPAFSQDVPTHIVRDGSIGPDQTTQPLQVSDGSSGKQVVIGEELGARSADGQTLFHSFVTFDVGQGDSARFIAASGLPTRAVIARVTGGGRTNIFGTVSVEILRAEFYLLNSAGFLFGPEARLDGVGSFLFAASTADRLRFANGASFAAGSAEFRPSVLSVDEVVEFDFDHPSGSIRAEGDRATTLLSGTRGALIAGTPGTRIGLERHQEADSGGFKPISGLTLLASGDAAGLAPHVGSLRLENVEILTSSRAGLTLLSGGSVEILDTALDSEDGLATIAAGPGAGLQVLSTGPIRIVDSRIGTLSLEFDTNGSLSDQLDMNSTQLLGKGAERVSIAGESVEILRSEVLGEDLLSLASRTSLDVIESRLFSNFGGNFRLRGGTSLILDHSSITNQGLSNFLRSISRIDLEAPLVEVVNGSRVSTAAENVDPLQVAVAGDISVRANRFRLSSSALSSQVTPGPVVLSSEPLNARREMSRAGSISIVAGDIEILDRSSLISSALGSAPPPGSGPGDLPRGSAGEISLHGVRSVRIADSEIDTRVGTQSSLFRGSIQVLGGDVQIQSASISAEAILGNAGAVDVRSSGALTVRDSSIASSSLGAGSAGSVSISGTAVSVDGSFIRSSNMGQGPAGSVSVDATTLSVMGDSEIATRANQGPPSGQPADGNIEIRVSDGLLLTRESTINASVEDGQGGDIRIGSPDFVVLRQGSRILAQTSQGNGGRVDINARAFLADSSSDVNADASVGTSGTVDIGSPDVDLQGSIESLPAEFLNASTLLRPSCEARERSGETASLFVAKASGLPASPEEWLLAFDGPAIPPGTDRTAPVGAGTKNDIVAALDLARSQQASGAYGRSLATLTLALSRAEAGGDRAGFAGLLAAAGNAQQALGEREAAEELLTRGSRVVREEGGSPLRSWIENDLGNHYATRGESEHARTAYAEAIAAAERANDSLAATKALGNAARLALESERADEAEGLLDRADERVPAVPDQSAKAAVLIHLGRSRALQAQRASNGPRHDASLLRAHALFQSAAELGRKLGDARLSSYALGNLGSLYQGERRYEEALALTREALREAERAESSDPLYRWHWQEGQLLWAQGKAQPAVEAYRRAVSLLEATRQESRVRYGERADSFGRTLAPVYMDLVDALLHGADSIQDPARVEAVLIEARATLEQLKAAELRNYLRDDCSAELEARTASVDSLASGAAVIYPIALPDRLELLVRLPTGLQRYTVPVGAANIEAAARSLRQLLQDRTSVAYRPVAQQLYDWLVRPYAGRLGSGVETLVFVPSGALRSVPMSALHDGKGFLVERFAVATAPGLSLVDPRPLDLSNVTPLLGGVSEAVQEFAALGNVPSELWAIRDLFGGQVLLDEGFQADAIRTAIRESRPTLLHFASHAVFTGDPRTSFLLTHDGRMTMGDLVALLGPTRLRPDPVELLVLSACDTAVGDDRAALGLAGVAVRSGARSALGSLWAIADEAASPLIVSFYKSLHKPGTSRAAALRQAQREMLASEKFSHPFYWSTLVLISNWL